MNLRPKTKRRLLMLLTAGIVITGATSAEIVYHLHRYEQRRASYRTAGMEAYQRADYRTAVAQLTRYVGNDRLDPEAIYVLAVSRSRLPREDMGHLLEAKGLFNRYLELKPTDLRAQHQLLEIYQKLGYPAETLTLANSVLERNPDDVPALSAKLHQTIHDGNLAPALSLSQRMNELAPLDIRSQETTIELMHQLHHDPSELISRADKLLALHPGDPRFELVRAVAAHYADDSPGTTEWLRKAASHPTSDPELILLLVGAFDHQGLWTDSRDLLEQAGSSSNAPPAVRAALVQRLWELDQDEAALDVLKDISPADPAADSNLLGLKALVLTTEILAVDPTGQPSSARELTAVMGGLQNRSSDLVASSWVSLLTTIAPGAPVDVLQRVQMCESAERMNADNPDILFFLGQHDLQMGETELARQSLLRAIQIQPEWAAPSRMVARILLQRGEPENAARPAQAAYDRDPQSNSTRITFALTAYQQINGMTTPSQLRQILDLVRELRISNPDDPQLLAINIDLLVRSDRKQDAVDLAIASLATSTPSSPMTLLEIAKIDRIDSLGLNSLLADRAAGCHPTTPAQSLALVQVYRSTNHIVAGTALLPSIANHPTPDWKLASLQAREALGDTHTGPDWESLAEAMPRNLQVQQAVLQSAVAGSNRALIDHTIDRLKALTGDGAIEWRLARARWQLDSTEDAKNNANAAAVSMAEVVRMVPQYAEPQVLWADALIKLGDFTGAIAHLRIALSLDPGSADISLTLARLLVQAGQIHEANVLVDQVQGGTRLNGAERVETARLYRQIGMPRKAITLLSDGHDIHPDDPARDLLLAQLLVEQGDKAAAGAMYDAMIEEPTASLPIAKATAWFQASGAQLTRARQSLHRLDEIGLPAGEREAIFGELELAFGNKETAVAEFQNATRAGPSNPHTWLSWASMLLCSRDFSAASQLIDQGLQHLPGDPMLLALKERTVALAGLQPDADLQPLIEALSADPKNEAGISTVAAIAESQAAHETSDQLMDRLSVVVEHDPFFMPVTTILIGLECTAGRFDQAVDQATRAGQLMPADPEPARLLTSVLIAANRWDDALSAAEEWRNRTLGNPQPADVAIARIQIALKHPQRAADALSPYLSQASSGGAIVVDDSSLNANTVELYIRSLAMLDRTDDAWTIATAEPSLVARSAVWRNRWLQIVATTAKDAASGAGRIQQVTPLASPNSVNDQIGLAQAWFTLGSRFGDNRLLTKAKSIIDPLMDTSPAPAEAWQLLGSIDQQLNDLPAAELAMGKAVEGAPGNPVAKNNLAMLMMLRNEDPRAAQQLAEQAIKIAPTSSGLHSTLGEIDVKLNDLTAAQSQFEMAVRLDKTNAEALIGLGSVQAQSGKLTDASATLDKVETLLDSANPTLPGTVQEELQQLRKQLKRSAG